MSPHVSPERENELPTCAAFALRTHGGPWKPSHSPSLRRALGLEERQLRQLCWVATQMVPHHALGFLPHPDA